MVATVGEAPRETFRERVWSEVERWAHNITHKRHRNKDAQEEIFIPLHDIRVAHGASACDSPSLAQIVRRPGTGIDHCNCSLIQRHGTEADCIAQRIA